MDLFVLKHPEPDGNARIGFVEQGLGGLLIHLNEIRSIHDIKLFRIDLFFLQESEDDLLVTDQHDTVRFRQLFQGHDRPVKCSFWCKITS